jgi:hypothetical protein
MRPASGDLLRDANTAFQTIFNTYEPRTDVNAPPLVARGTSGQGWDYLIIKRAIGKPSNPPGQWATLQGFVMVARLSSNLAVISGLSKVPLVSSCFGELLTNVWPRFFYSLRFKDWPVTDQSVSIANKLAGTWTLATATAGSQYTFAANGRYDSAAAAQQYNLLNNGQGLTTTQAYFGNGSYALKENAITLTPDSGPPKPGFFRIEEESKDNGRSWTQLFYLLSTSTVDGTEYEVRYKKN